MEPWLRELAVPVYREAQEAEARYKAACLEKRAAERALEMALQKMDGIKQVAAMQGVTEEQIAEAVRAEAAAAPVDTRPSLSTSDLMGKAAEFLKESGYPRTVDDIIKALEAQGLRVPPRSNLLAYISRSHLIKSVRRGLYVAA